MTINEYQQGALRTASLTGKNKKVSPIVEILLERGYPVADLMLLNGALGLGGESGEVEDIVKKFIFQGHPLDKAHIAKELGDVAWYLAVAAYSIGYTLEEVLQMNIDKLKERYPDGFDVDKSLHREAGDI